MLISHKQKLESMVERADRLLADLRSVYQRDLHEKSISMEALNLTHEVIEKCSNTLDQCMTALFESEIRPKLTNLPKRGGYFPAASDDASYRSTMGQWGTSKPEELIPDTDAKLRSLQPFTDDSNNIFGRIRAVANKKHTGLTPQIRREQRRVNVSSSQGGVSWGPGVTFGTGVRVMGVPIDPRTQMPAHSQGVDVTVETWVSFHLEDGGEDAYAFCCDAVAATRRALSVLL